MRDAAVFLFVDARRPSSPCDTSRKRQRTFGAPTRFTPCCRIFHADRFALWENPQRSLRSLLRLRLQGREIRRNFSKTYAGLPLPVTIRKVNGQMVEFRVNVNTHMYKKWNILMYNNGITHLLRESPEAHACL